MILLNNVNMKKLLLSLILIPAVNYGFAQIPEQIKERADLVGGENAEVAIDVLAFKIKKILPDKNIREGGG